MWDYLFAQISTIPSRTKSLNVSSSPYLEDHLHVWKIMCSIEIEILFTVLSTHALREATLQSVTPLHRVGGDTSYME